MWRLGRGASLSGLHLGRVDVGGRRRERDGEGRGPWSDGIDGRHEGGGCYDGGVARVVADDERRG